MATSFYDVVVLGDDLAGTVAAAHLARRGFRTLLACSTPSERDHVGGFALPRAPLALTGLEAPALKRLSGELHLLQLLRRRVEPLSPAFQLLLPDHRLDVVAEEVGRELDRELPAETAAFEAWAAWAGPVSAKLESLVVEDVTLPPDGFWDRRDLKRIAAQLPGDHAAPSLPPGARMLVELPARFASDLVDPGAIASARLADLHHHGTWHLEGGAESLRQLLLDRIKTYSGEVRFGVPVHGVELKRGRVAAVVLGERRESLGCGHVICAMPAGDVIPLLPGTPPHKLAAAARVPAALHRYLLHLVAPLDALPDALGRLAYSVLDPGRPLLGANALCLHTTPGQGQHAVLTVEALTPDPSPPALRALRQAIRAHLDGVLPFLTRHLRLVWSPHDGLPAERAPHDRGELPEAGDASLAPPARPMTPLWSIDEPRALGVCGLPHATGVDRLLLASQQQVPGLGLEGQLVAGWGAARLVAARDKRRVVEPGVLRSPA